MPWRDYLNNSITNKRRKERTLKINIILLKNRIVEMEEKLKEYEESESNSNSEESDEDSEAQSEIEAIDKRAQVPRYDGKSTGR